MKPRDIFGVVVRSVGLLALLASLLYLYSVFVALYSSETRSGSSPLTYIGAFIVTFLFSIYFLRGAPHLVRFAYGSENQDSDDKNPSA